MDKTNSLKKPFSPYFKNVEIEDGELKTINSIQNIFIFWQDQEKLTLRTS